VRSILGLLHKVYAGLLMLYPKAFREEYGEELQFVFDLSMDEAATKGGFELEGLILRELVSLPKAVFLEHLRERRNEKMIRNFDSYFNFASGSWKEYLTALIPFFLAGGLMPVLNYLGRAGVTTNAVRTVIMLALFGIFLILLAVGVKVGMPRWSLSYLGFLLAILSTYLFSIVFGTPLYFLFGNVRGELLIMDILWGGIFWYGLLAALVVLIVMSRTIPFFQRFRSDWTQLCFILYGGVPFALWMTFDEYVGDEPYMFASFLVLAVGAWFYLRSQGEWKRFGSLFVALTLAISIAAGGKAILIPAQDWPFTIDQGLVVAEVKHTIIMWGWFAAGMLLPVAARFLPQSDRSSHTTVSEG
jgi:hypothetical protein